MTLHKGGDNDPTKIHEEQAKDGRTGQDITFKYTTYKVAGNGSFGVVYQAKVVGTGESVAIKKVFQDRRFKVGLGSFFCRWYIIN